MKWQQIIKLGKNTIVRLLQELEVTFNIKANYFYLCKLYKDSISEPVLTMGNVHQDLKKYPHPRRITDDDLVCAPLEYFFKETLTEEEAEIVTWTWKAKLLELRKELLG